MILRNDNNEEPHQFVQEMHRYTLNDNDAYIHKDLHHTFGDHH